MSCTATVPNLTASDRARFLYDAIPPGLFRVENEQERIAWRIGPEPFALSAHLAERIESLGRDLVGFYRALNALYNRSARGSAPAFVAEYLDRGKPEHVVRLARQHRFKQEIPAIIRPDLILTEDGFIASELDSVPGGMGFLGAMTRAYCELGSDSLGGANGIAEGFAAAIRTQTGKERAAVAIVVSEESGDYRSEMTWLAQTLRESELLDAYVCTPHEIVFTEEALLVRLDDARELRLDAIYRNFELFDLLNVPKSELMLYAARHNRVKMTPPPKAHLEEKLAFALFHHPALAAYWQDEMGGETYERLLGIFPQTWVIDPRPLPPQAVIYGLEAGGKPVSDWMALAELGKSERDFVVKPSGFSPLAWGSRGVRVANDLTKDEWQAALSEAIASFDRTPYILQRFHKGRRVRQSYYDRERDEVSVFEGRVRLCPYYFVAGEDVTLGGVLATIAPADKRLIHGMSDAVMAPSAVSEDPA